MCLGTFFDFFGKKLELQHEIIIFSIVNIFLFGVSQYFLMGYSKEILNKVVRTKFFSMLTYTVTFIPYVILVLLLTMTIDMAFNSKYATIIYVVSMIMGTLPSVVILGLLCLRLFSWFKSTKNIMILFLSLSALTGAICALGNIDVVVITLTEKPSEITYATQNNFGVISSSQFLTSLFYLLIALPIILSFIFEWAGISFVLYHFSKKIGKIKFWLLTVTPLIATLIGFLPSLFGSTSSDFSFFREENLNFRILTTIGADVGVFVMGFGYLLVARSVKKINPQSNVANYMSLSAFGLIVLGISLQSPAMFASYPPHGFATHCFLITASYLFSIGFYSSAISVSEDIKLRKSIKKHAHELTLLDNIGSAKMESDIQKKVLSITKTQFDLITQETGIQPSLTEEDMKQYLDQVINEIKNKQK
jgi:hypothetical protein